MTDDERSEILQQAFATLERTASITVTPVDPLDRPDRQRPAEPSRPVERHPAATAQAPDWSGWENWLAARLATERAHLIEVIGVALGEMLRKERRAAKAELDDSVRSLRLELAEANSVIIELRRTIAASDRGTSGEIIDLPSRRGGMN